ncbi:MAG: GNAT family N-acetyltransferase [Flavobacteriaceae bacterium]|nr:GNAT family N-acetyltransferase [Flavobacteriaceae bacterium]
MTWLVKKFNEISLNELYDILQLRINVFIVEQNCPYPELDNKDKKAFHLFSKDKNANIIAYTRIFKPGDYYKEVAFGRVVVHKDFRNQKLGYKLIEQTINKIEQLFGNTPIKIGAQTYLKEFYESFDFQQVGKEYIEDGIPHIYMIKAANEQS